ncbi:hypothetical protein [Pedobacter sp. UYP1]|jgi:hypothetical protein|uniref:hypothetical protein n=1 Tax=Pedobacter sp. UYP1 TaxID=1756396 RepID=UPI003392E671
MKISLFWFGVFALCLFAACKKDNTVPAELRPDPLLALGDSCSYQMDGKSYSFTYQNGFQMGNAQTNLKLDSVVKSVRYYSGDKDSVMFSRSYDFNAKEYNAGINISFAKKYNKKEMGQSMLGLFVPKNGLDLFQPGNYKYPIDYEREHTQNGIAINLYTSEDFSSYSKVSIGRPTVITSESQQQSKFEIIRCVKLSNNTYLLEAKFNAVVFDREEKVKKNVENGYLRLILY